MAAGDNIKEWPVGDLAYAVGHDKDGHRTRQVSPLKNLPGFASPKIAAMGDSRTARNSATGTSGAFGIQRDFYTNGFAFWATSRLAGRAEFPVELNAGVSGDSSAMILARVPAHIVAMQTAGSSIVVLFGCCTNDRTTGNDPQTPYTAAQTQANLLAIFALYRAAGIRIVYVPETPRGATGLTTFALTGQQLRYHLAMHRWGLEVAGMIPGVTVKDVWPLWAEYDSTLGYALAASAVDGLHQSVLGAQQVGYAVADALSPMLPGLFNGSAQDATDAWHADNPFGNFAPNGVMAGTGGSAGAGTTGSVATSWTTLVNAAWSGGTTMVVTNSKVAGTNYGWQQEAVSGTASATANPQLELFRSAFTLGNFTAGDVLRATARIEIDNPVNLKAVFLVAQLVDAGGSTYRGRSGMPASGLVSALPAVSMSGADGLYLQTPDIPWAGLGGALSSARLSIFIEAMESTTFSGTVRIGGLRWAKRL